MRCEESRELLDLYMDGELAEETRQRVERHLLRCADCSFQVRTLEQTRLLLREAHAAAEAVPSPAFCEKMHARLHDAFRERLQVEAPVVLNQRTLPFPPDGEREEMRR
jgi:anti-sigma factor RsiW